MTRVWYGFIGNKADPYDTENYYKLSRDIEHCLCGENICAVYLGDNGTHPHGPFSKNIQQYIDRALSTGKLQPEMPLTAKKYVYLKY